MLSVADQKVSDLQLRIRNGRSYIVCVCRIYVLLIQLKIYKPSQKRERFKWNRKNHQTKKLRLIKKDYETIIINICLLRNVKRLWDYSALKNKAPGFCYIRFGGDQNWGLHSLFDVHASRWLPRHLNLTLAAKLNSTLYRQNLIVTLICFNSCFTFTYLR